RGKKRDQGEETGDCDSPRWHNRRTILRRAMVPPVKPGGDACERVKRGQLDLAREPRTRQPRQLRVRVVPRRGRGGGDPANFGKLGDICLLAIGVAGETGGFCRSEVAARPVLCHLERFLERGERLACLAGLQEKLAEGFMRRGTDWPRRQGIMRVDRFL